MIPFAFSVGQTTPKIAHSHGGIIKYMAPSAQLSQPPNGTLISSAVFGVTNTQTDRQTTLRATSVAIGRIYAM